VTDVGYVIAGWSITAVVLGGYTLRLTIRLRRGERAASVSASEPKA